MNAGSSDTSIRPLICKTGREDCPGGDERRDIAYRGRKARLVYVRDISERRRSEEILAEREKHYRLLFDSTRHLPEFCWKTRPANILEANPADVPDFGYSHDDTAGGPECACARSRRTPFRSWPSPG